MSERDPLELETVLIHTAQHLTEHGVICPPHALLCTAERVDGWAFDIWFADLRSVRRFCEEMNPARIGALVGENENAQDVLDAVNCAAVH